MDSIKIDKEGAKPLSDEFKQIEAIKTKKDLQKEIVHLHTIGNYPFFFIYAAPGRKEQCDGYCPHAPGRYRSS